MQLPCDIVYTPSHVGSETQRSGCSQRRAGKHGGQRDDRNIHGHWRGRAANGCKTPHIRGSRPMSYVGCIADDVQCCLFYSCTGNLESGQERHFRCEAGGQPEVRGSLQICTVSFTPSYYYTCIEFVFYFHFVHSILGSCSDLMKVMTTFSFRSFLQPYNAFSFHF